MKLITGKRLAGARAVRHWLRASSGEEGFNLLEALMAIVVIAITASMITPAFVLAVATRVQSQKAEQALQLAQDQVGKARVTMEVGSVDDPSTPATELRQNFLPDDATQANVEAVPAPTVAVALTDNRCIGDDLNSLQQVPADSEACQVDVNSDGDPDFLVQSYRVNEFIPDQGTNPDAEIAYFEMGVRVYAIEAEANLGALETRRASVGLSSNPNRTDGNGNPRRNTYLYSPLAVIYTTIARSEETDSLCDYFESTGLSDTDLENKGLLCNL